MTHHTEPQVFAIDAEYVRPRLAAVHLIVDQGRAAFVDTGTYRTVPNLLAALDAHGLRPEEVDYVLLTHVHLDHAGGAGTLMQALPNAKCVVHPRGARHMSDPGKLTAASIDVYGQRRFNLLYGVLQPIPAERVLTVTDGQQLRLGSRTLEFIHTPGHANHHYCIVDRAGGIIFSGDTFGLSYRELDTERGPFAMPISTPSQFDPAAAHASIDRLLSYQPRAIYLTHYSRVEDLQRMAADLHECLDGYVALAKQHAAHPDRTRVMVDDMFAFIGARLDAHGVRKDDAFRHALLDGDIKLNVHGLDVWLRQISQ
jgi:glyoxylase-like metal-dependent hydrolase (beta-lactamase superfamily II)